MKITVIGDIMCERPVLRAGKRKDGSYNFDDMFKVVKPMFEESDFVVGNLEFPVAGEEFGYGDDFFKFNAPCEYAEAVKNAGIDLVSTINNHTLDRGIDGIISTMKNLEEIGLEYTGTFHPKKEREEAYYFECEGMKIAVIAYTYGINKNSTEDDGYSHNFNRLARYKNRVCGKKEFPPENIIDLFIKNEKRNKKIKKFFKIPYLPAQIDNLISHEMVDEYVERMCDDIKKAKEKADFVIFYPHTGGQFNREVGDFTKNVFEKALDAGADAIIASHSHIVQKAEFCGNVPCAYSLGNFSMVPDSPVTVGKFFCGYGLAMHLYIKDKKLEKVTFSILKAVKKHGKQLVSWPVDKLYDSLKSKKEKEKLKSDICKVYEEVCNKKLEGDIIKKEYIL